MPEESGTQNVLPLSGTHRGARERTYACGSLQHAGTARYPPRLWKTAVAVTPTRAVRRR